MHCDHLPRARMGPRSPDLTQPATPVAWSCCEALQAPFLRFFVLGGWGRSPPVFALLFSQAVRRCAAGAGTAVPGAETLPSRPYFSAVQRGALGACAAPEGALFCPLGGLFFSPERGSPAARVSARARTRIREGLKRISTPFSIGESVCVGTVFGMCRNGIRHVSERYCVCVTTVSAAGLG